MAVRYVLILSYFTLRSKGVIYKQADVSFDSLLLLQKSQLAVSGCKYFVIISFYERTSLLGVTLFNFVTRKSLLSKSRSTATGLTFSSLMDEKRNEKNLKYVQVLL